MRYLQEEQIKELKTREALEEVLDFYEEHDKWYRVKADGVKALGKSNYPLFFKEFQEQVHCSEDLFEKCMEETGIFLEIPFREENKTLIYPIRQLGLQSVYERSGSNCRLVRTIHSHGAITALSAETRGELINLGYSTSTEEILFYISDEMISYNGSKMYVILPYKKGVTALEEEMAKMGDLQYRNGFISHACLVVQWYIKNGDTESHRLFLEDLKIVSLDDEVKYIITFSSSNIGNAKMSARLSCQINDTILPIGNPKSVWHLASKAVKNVTDLTEQNGASIKHFRYKLQKLGASLKENEDNIERMGNTIICHPYDCFENLLDLLPTLPAKIKQEAIEQVNFAPDTTAMDIYLEIATLANELTDKNRNNLVQITEEIAQLQYVDYTKFDKKIYKM